MKTKKVVVGAIAASMLSLSAFPGSVFAAGETVQVSAGTDTAKAGETFEVEVTLADVPSTGIQGVDFSITFDTSLLTNVTVEEGELVKNAAKNDPTAAGIALFGVNAPEGKNYINVSWSNSYTDPSYWINSDGVFCVIKGTVASGASNGATAKLEIGPVVRETRPESGQQNDSVGIGYSKDGNSYSYAVNVTNGSVVIGEEATTGTTGSTHTVRGDVNLDDVADMSDVVAIMRWYANKADFPLSEQGIKNGDVVGNGDGLTNSDALQIQKFEAGVVTEL